MPETIASVMIAAATIRETIIKSMEITAIMTEKHAIAVKAIAFMIKISALLF